MHWLWTPLFPFEYFDEKKYFICWISQSFKRCFDSFNCIDKDIYIPFENLKSQNHPPLSKLAWFWSSLDGNKFGDDDQWTNLLEHQSSEEGDSHWINTCRFDSCTHFCTFNPMGPVALSVFSFFVASIKRFSFFTHPLGGGISKTKLLNLRGSLEASKY